MSTAAAPEPDLDRQPDGRLPQTEPTRSSTASAPRPVSASVPPPPSTVAQPAAVAGTAGDTAASTGAFSRSGAVVPVLRARSPAPAASPR